jgi:hypothetical protein
MIGLLVKLVLGVVLFAGSLVGGLAATGRLNHEGTANIPVLNSFFPPPPPPSEGEGEHGEGGAAAAHGAVTAAHEKDGHAAADAHAAPGGESKPKAADAAHAAVPAGGDAGAPQDPQRPTKQKTGKSLVEPEKPAGGGGHGGGHGEADAGHGETKDAHGADPHGKAEAHGADAHGKEGAHGKPAKPKPPKTAESDFQGLESSLAAGGSPYAPGEFFRFQGMPAGITPEQLNEAWLRVQDLVKDIEKRRVALELREKEVQGWNDDVSRRQAELGAMQARLDEMQRAIDAKIAKFQEQVKLVRNDEVAALKRNAATLASFEPAKAAEIVQDQWKSEKGQDEVLRLFEFMDKDAVNEILKVLPVPMTQDVMKKRLRVSKEAAPTGR